ncbi:peptidylprolyl isomerase [Patiriisocius marinistellae]|uniref:Trigger factor n=1 Tax=Patiriisocius marinistellae TaxID=2494560 RepID=A0A5J4G3D9_9FLAO|nr:trigger factor [Patiriisocius marinistellae]GEQ87376.1 peptidylprolyl isomerase [Patiriisocius marinistellae]
MDITKKDIDALNAVVTVEIKKEDYEGEVKKVLANYRKTANIPGFRKGHIPMGMVKKQYGQAVLVEEVNKLLQGGLQKFLTEEKLDVLGNPLPKNENEIDWKSEDFTFEFDLGMSPKFEVDVTKKAITNYKVVADDKMLDNQVKTIRKQYGKLTSKDKAEKGDEITGTFSNEEKGVEKSTTLELDELKGKSQIKALTGAKVGDVITLKTKGMFAEDHEIQKHIGLTPEDAKDVDELTFKVEEVNTREMAEMNQELFDKLFGEGVVKSEADLKSKIKEDAEKQFEQQSDQKMLNDVVESLIENTKFDLPKEFLERWIQVSSEKPMTDEEAKAEYERSEKGLRYQLIEGKLRAENNLQASFEELKEYSRGMIKAQMAQFGQMDPSDEELDNIAARIMSNQEEVQRMGEQLNTNKLLQFFKEKAKLKTKEVTYEKFIKEAYE